MIYRQMFPALARCLGMGGPRGMTVVTNGIPGSVSCCRSVAKRFSAVHATYPATEWMYCI